jgi:hypothetical protein
MHLSQVLRGLATRDELVHVHRRTGDKNGPYHVISDIGADLIRRMEADGLIEWVINPRYPKIEEMTLTEKGKNFKPY